MCLQILLRLLDLLLQGRGLGLELDNGRRVLDLEALKAVEEASVLLDGPRALVFHALAEVLLLRLDLVLQLLVLLPDAAQLDSEGVYLLGLGLCGAFALGRAVRASLIALKLWQESLLDLVLLLLQVLEQLL